MYCGKCGNEIENDSKFCSFCGAHVKEVMKNTVIEESESKVEAKEQEHLPSEDQEQYEKQKTVKKENKKFKIILIASIVAAVVVLGIFVIIPIFNNGALPAQTQTAYPVMDIENVFVDGDGKLIIVKSDMTVEKVNADAVAGFTTDSYHKNRIVYQDSDENIFYLDGDNNKVKMASEGKLGSVSFQDIGLYSNGTTTAIYDFGTGKKAENYQLNSAAFSPNGEHTMLGLLKSAKMLEDGEQGIYSYNNGELDRLDREGDGFCFPLVAFNNGAYIYAYFEEKGSGFTDSKFDLMFSHGEKTEKLFSTEFSPENLQGVMNADGTQALGYGDMGLYRFTDDGKYEKLIGSKKGTVKEIIFSKSEKKVMENYIVYEWPFLETCRTDLHEFYFVVNENENNVLYYMDDKGNYDKVLESIDIGESAGEYYYFSEDGNFSRIKLDGNIAVEKEKIANAISYFCVEPGGKNAYYVKNEALYKFNGNEENEKICSVEDIKQMYFSENGKDFVFLESTGYSGGDLFVIKNGEKSKVASDVYIIFPTRQQGTMFYVDLNKLLFWNSSKGEESALMLGNEEGVEQISEDIVNILPSFSLVYMYESFLGGNSIMLAAPPAAPYDDMTAVY